ncbi:MAG: hypothetical protein ACKPEQ_23510, partial [Dolichospermum sp.]
LATQRPEYLIKKPEQKFWCVQVERMQDGERTVSFNYFNCPKKAKEFDRNHGHSCFDVSDFRYSTIEEMRKRRGVKHF